MIHFEKFILDNGLRVIVHQDKNTPIVAVNTLYDVGARDEQETKTGFAHLFEHLMFGGSVNIPNFDGPLQQVGGENNAFTSNDITNYYVTLPKKNIETAFWLESDRMLSLDFSEKSLEVQRQVVIEEFKQRYLNQPYGDVWLLLRPLVYQVHPYKWATIGKEIAHIEQAILDDVKDFFHRFYHPSNAILSIAGNVDLEEIKFLVNKWYGDIPKKEVLPRELPKEPAQTERRTLTVERDVPSNAIYMVYKMCGRTHEDYYASDLLSDILGRGEVSRLYHELVKNQKLFTEIGASITGSHDQGLLVISGKLIDGVSFEKVTVEIEKVISHLLNEGIEEEELKRIKAKNATILAFENLDVLNKSMNLAIAEVLGDANTINDEGRNYERVQVADILKVGKMILKESQSSILYYAKK